MVFPNKETKSVFNVENIEYLLTFLLAFLTACSQNVFDSEQGSTSDTASQVNTNEGREMGPSGSMMDYHHAYVPDEFTGLTNPIKPDDRSLERRAAVYTSHCGTCHGDYGNGDGPGGVSFEPSPAPIAHTRLMMSDAYLFWRITDGGLPGESEMIPYRDILVDSDRWDVINYVRALGKGIVQPEDLMGGDPFDPVNELVQRVEMLELGVEQGVITQVEADIFDLVHKAMDQLTVREEIKGFDTLTNRADALPQILDALVIAGDISPEQSDVFLEIHDRLVKDGLKR